MRSILCVFIASIFISVNSQTSGSCRTPISETGQCVPIKTCLALVDALQRAPRPLPPNLVDYLQKSHCGRKDNEHHVCCATRHISTTKPTQPSMVMPDTSTVNNNAPDISILRHTNLNLLSLDRCGRIAADRIAFGNLTNLGEFPWMALLQYNTPSGLKFQCGGTLISSRYVLTAAHCVTGIRSPLVSVRLGEHDVNKDSDCETFDDEEYCLPPVQDIGIEEIRFHPSYNTPKFTHDIAIIRLQREATLNENVLPICLPVTPELQTQDLKKLIVSGWGLTETGSASNELLKANIDIVENVRCQELLKRSVRLTPSHMCASGPNGVDSCKGDSGGPVFFHGNIPFGKIKLRYVQYGVVSAGGSTCGSRDNLPGLYTKVSSYMRWVLDQMRP